MTQDNEIIELTVPDNMHMSRLDKVVAELCDDLSRSRLKPLIKEGCISVNGQAITQVSFKVPAKSKLILSVPPAVDDTPKPENIPLDIVYEDDDLLVINKAIGMVVHPGAGNHDGTLVNALLYHCRDNLSGIGGVKRPGIVHRLDKDTSGLMIVAKNDLAHQGLSEQLQDHSLYRVYAALVWKVPLLRKGKVDHAIGRHPTNRLKMALKRGEDGRHAVTHYTVEETFGEYASHVTCQLETGRTHQIRVHMQHLGHPLIGDPLYGLPDQEGVALLKKADYEGDRIEQVMAYGRQALHAKAIAFIHPRNGEEMRFESEYPQDWLNLKKCLKSAS